MSEATLELQILTPTGPVPGADCVSTPGVYLPGHMGELGILPDHIPFLTPLRPGVLRFSSEGKDLRFAVGGGFVEVSAQGKVTVLSDRVLGAADLKSDEVKTAYQECETRLKAAAQESIESESFKETQREFEWLEAQMQLSGPHA